MGSRAELKEQNRLDDEVAKKPVEDQEETPFEVVEPEAEEVEEEIEAAAEVDALEEEEPEAEDVPEFMLAEDEGEEPSGDQMPVSAHIKAKDKFKGKIADKDDEITQLKSRLAQFESGATVAQPVQVGTPPTMPIRAADDYDGARHQSDMAKWAQEFAAFTSQSALNTVQQTQASGAAQANFNTAVERHYDRVAAFADKNKISAEAYKGAETRVMEAIDAVMPGQGQLVTQQLLASSGAGSEKAVYWLGRNPSKLAALVGTLDASGIATAMEFARISERMAKTTNRKSNAPPPAKQLQGDRSADSAAKTRKKYDELHKKGRTSEAFKLRRQAKKAGVDTSGWIKD